MSKLGACVERMKTKLFLEPKGRVREEIILESVLPDKWTLFKKWKQGWVSKKEFKDWLKKNWPVEKLGELREGRILKIAAMEDAIDKPKGKLFAFRSYYLAQTGEKKKLPIVLFGQLKSNYKLESLINLYTPSEEQLSELKQDFKTDPWVPLSVWHAKPINRNEAIPITELVSTAVDYGKAVFYFDFKSIGVSSFSETEIFKG